MDKGPKKQKGEAENVREKKKKKILWLMMQTCFKLTHLFKTLMPLPQKILLTLACQAAVTTLTVHRQMKRRRKESGQVDSRGEHRQEEEAKDAWEVYDNLQQVILLTLAQVETVLTAELQTWPSLLCKRHTSAAFQLQNSSRIDYRALHLEAFMLMATEKDILITLDTDRIM